MTQLAESPAGAEPEVYFRPVIFTPSGRDDCLAVARMSFEDWVRLDYEGGLSEWVDGEARLYMSATAEHQAIIEFLHILMGLFVQVRQAGFVKLAPYAMQSARGGRGREPDLMFVATANLDRLQSDYLHGPPDLIVEVVSKDSVTRDGEEKLAEYAVSGVREYWVIDSRITPVTARFYILEDGAFRAMDPGPDGVYRASVIEGFWLRTEWLSEDPRPAAHAVRELLGASFA